MSQLELWRRTQVVVDETTSNRRTMSIADAVAQLSGIVGKDVPYQTWYGWERKGTGPRDDALVIALFRMTNGQWRPDHCYDLPDLRAERAAAMEAQQCVE